MALISTASSSTSDASVVDARTWLPKRFLVALDASDHANRALKEAIRVGHCASGTVMGIHVYAAKLHDRRFQQMEAGLPERYREEKTLESQREIHGDLITRGLKIVSDSYHDIAERACIDAGLSYRRLSPEGKNYGRIIEAACSGDFDVLALGAFGLGVAPESLIGTVCDRVVRRSPIDVLVIRNPERSIATGPLVVGLDGSPRSFGALQTAFAVARAVGTSVHAVAAFDPFYHYVAFKKISEGLSEEAARRFRFKEQELLHEEIIDHGLAEVYRSYLDIARTLAQEADVMLTCELLVGKPHRVITQYLEKVSAGAVLVGKTGIHADDGLDIGGTSENLVRTASCQVWIVASAFMVPLEVIAPLTIIWTPEAEQKMERVPKAARNMVRGAILRYAHTKGHTVVTTSLIDEVTQRFCPARSDGPQETPPAWSDEATALIEGIANRIGAATTRLHAEKRARLLGARTVSVVHVQPFLGREPMSAPRWTAAALARLARIPALVRAASRVRIEALAQAQGAGEVTWEIAEAGIAQSLDAMEEAMVGGGHGNSDG
ncbi:MAG: universal stress protein [Rhizobiales bacterium]|nr:universal stress protein [Hyphomicrobiales bacterium]